MRGGLLEVVKRLRIATPSAAAFEPRPIHGSGASLARPLPPRRVIRDVEIEESFVKGSGPGGQVINKTSSAVQITHKETGIVVKAQPTRSREQNRKIARQILGEKLDALEKGDQSRSALKAAVKIKKKASKEKKSRRKYRKLAEDGVIASRQGEASEEAVTGSRDPLKDHPHEIGTDDDDLNAMSAENGKEV